MCPAKPLAAPRRHARSFAGPQALPQQPPSLKDVDREKLKQMAKNMHQLDNKLAGRRDLAVLFVVGDEAGRWNRLGKTAVRFKEKFFGVKTDF